MSQNRKAPAYQEYAADILAQLPFRTISLQDRGLLWTMRMECWVNKHLPSDPHVIARALGLPVNEVAASLPAVMPFFKIEGDLIVCPELENYRKYIEARKKKLSKSGKKGAEITNKKRRNKPEDTTSNDMSATPQPPCRGENGLLVELSRDEKSLVEQSKDQFSRDEHSLNKEVTKDPFIAEMEEYEAEERNGTFLRI